MRIVDLEPNRQLPPERNWSCVLAKQASHYPLNLLKISIESVSGQQMPQGISLFETYKLPKTLIVDDNVELGSRLDVLLLFVISIDCRSQ
jgi:hypothetical protein